jgi:hypothetical protein
MYQALVEAEKPSPKCCDAYLCDDFGLAETLPIITMPLRLNNL